MPGLPPRFLILTLALTVLVASIGCQRHVESVDRSSGFEDFVPIYNDYIAKWIRSQEAQTGEQLARLQEQLDGAGPDEAAKLETRMTALRNAMEKWEFRKSLGPYFKFSEPSEIPSGLTGRHGRARNRRP